MTPLDQLQHTEIHPAWVWDCPECGRENFNRAITHYLDPKNEDDAEAIQAMYGELPPEGAVAACTSSPNRVVCRHCNQEFRPFREETNGDTDDES